MDDNNNPYMKFRLFALLACVFLLLSCGNKVSVVWTEGEVDPATGRAVQTLTVVNAPEGTDWTVWMTANHIITGKVEGSEGHLELFHGCLYKMIPAAREGEDLVVKYAQLTYRRAVWTRINVYEISTVFRECLDMISITIRLRYSHGTWFRRLRL